jgi:enediyne biosynthesis protein E4
MTETSMEAGQSRDRFNKTGWFLFVILILFIVSYIGFQQITGTGFLITEDSPFIFYDATDGSGLESHLRPVIYNDNPGYLETMGGGVAVGDFDGDGREDIFFATMPPFEPEQDTEDMVFRSVLFRNQGDGTFVDVTDEAGLGQIQGYPMGALFFDFNNNRRQDLYVASFDGGQLFRNEGGVYIDVTESSGVSLDGLCGELPCMAAAASAADYNKDGYLDLLIVNNVDWDIDDQMSYGLSSILPFNYKSQPSFLYRNNGDGTFTNVSEESGVTNLDTRGYGEDGKGLSAVWTDFNNNGWPDIYIANDMTPNRLYLNNGDGTFRDIAVAAGVDEIKSSMGIDTADYNYSGNLDLITTNLEGSMVSLFRNYGDLRFDYATAYSGLISSGRGSGWGVLFSDFDLDGHLDLFIANGTLLKELQTERENENLFYLNNTNGRFIDVTEEAVRFRNDEASRGLAVIDVNRTGKPDLIISNIDGVSSQLLINRTDHDNNWIRLDLEGVVSNRDAVGARVYIEREDGLLQNQIVKAGNSYQSTSSKSLFFGLGKSIPEKMTIHWPSGKTDIIETPPYNRILQIREGEREDEPATVVSEM